MKEKSVSSVSRYTIDEVVNIFKEKGYILLEKTYINNGSLLHCSDNDGYLFNITLSNLLQGQNPMRFIKSNPYTIQNIQNYFNKKNYNTEIISKKYVNSQTKLIFRCPQCGEIFDQILPRILNTKSEPLCKKCNRNIVSSGQRYKFEDVDLFFSQCNLKLLSENYVNNQVPLLCKSKEGYVGSISFNNLLRRHKDSSYPFFMPFSQKYNLDWFLHNIKIYIQNNNINCEAIGITKHQTKDYYLLSARCECGNVFDTSYHDVLNNTKTKCNICTKKQSNLETMVENFLECNNIAFVSQKIFKECRGIKRPLPFDFYIEELNLCIECDGRQHYMPISLFGGEQEFYKRQLIDNIKTTFCKDNDIKLVRLKEEVFRNSEYINILNQELNIIA